MIAFLRRFAPVAGALSMLALTGCSSVMQFPTSALPEPRPSAENVKQPSKAMQIAKAIKTTWGCVGCADTLLWDNEENLAKEAGFDPVEIQKTIVYGSKSSDGSSLSVGSGFMVADSLDGAWSNNVSLGAGLGVGLGLALLTGKSSIDYNPPTAYYKFGYVFPDNKKIRVAGFKADGKNIDEEHVRLYAAKRFVEVAAKTAEDFGFKRIGQLQVHFFRDYGPHPWDMIWQPLENDALGCPKVTEKSERENICRVEWGHYHTYGVDLGTIRYFDQGLIPAALGGNGKRTGWMTFFGYDRDHTGPLYFGEATNVKDEVKIQRDFVMGIQKHMTKGMYAYVPSYKIDGKNTPQVVMDKDHVYNFAVIVPREGAKVAPPAAK